MVQNHEQLGGTPPPSAALPSYWKPPEGMTSRKHTAVCTHAPRCPPIRAGHVSSPLCGRPVTKGELEDSTGVGVGSAALGVGRAEGLGWEWSMWGVGGGLEVWPWGG